MAEWQPWSKKLSDLTRAIQEDDNDEADSLLASGVDPNAHDGNGRTPLTTALLRNNGYIVQSLLRTGADATICTSDGQTPLQCAVNGGWWGLDALLKAGVDVSAITDPNSTLLSSAVLNDDGGTVDTLLEVGATANTATAKETPLHIVIENYNDGGHGRHILESLLAAGAHTNVLNADGFTPMSLTVYRQSDNPDIREIVQCLLKAGADPNFRDATGTPPMHQAIEMGCDEASLALVEDANADLNATDAEGQTPLMLACMHPISPIYKNLLHVGAVPNVRNVYGSTALHVAVGGKLHKTTEDEVDGDDTEDEVHEAVSLLLEFGADASSPNNDGKTAADLLAGDKKKQSIRVLLLRATTWDRRGWAIMLRKRPVEIGGGLMDGAGGDLSGAVKFLMMVREEGLFRQVVHFL